MNIPVSKSLALHAMASALDRQCDKLPQADAPFRLPDPVGVGRQIAELGRLIGDMGDAAPRGHIGRRRVVVLDVQAQHRILGASGWAVRARWRAASAMSTASTW